MKQYKERITLVKNGRGVWDLDPFKGCYYGTLENKNGCYGLCYANNISTYMGYDFSNVVYRKFENEKHIEKIGKQLRKIEFVRLGTMCDPSHDREHTLDIVCKIKRYNKNIVIVTKHWTTLNDGQLELLCGVCINTSICALDKEEQIKHRLKEYNRLKKHCKSVLRVNTFNFKDGLFKNYKHIQESLLRNDNVIENIMRLPRNHYIYSNKFVNYEKIKFIDSDVIASIRDKGTYFGKCSECIEKCGIGEIKKNLKNRINGL